MKGQNKLFFAIIIALILGVIAGGIVHLNYPDAAEGFSDKIKLLGTVFIRLVQMIIAPLVFTTLVVQMFSEQRRWWQPLWCSLL